MSLQEIFVVLCLTAVVLVQAYPAENIEGKIQEAVANVEPNAAEDSDLEGSESRYGGWGGYGGGWGGYRGGWGGYGGGWGGRGYGES